MATEVTANLIPGARFVSGYPLTVTIFPELLANGINVNVAVVPVPPKLFENVTVVDEIELTVVPDGNVTPPRVIIANIPGKIAFIEPVITAVVAATIDALVCSTIVSVAAIAAVGIESK